MMVPVLVPQTKSNQPASTNFGNSFLKLNPASLGVIDYFTPENHPYLNEADLDLGGSGPMIIPHSNFVVGGGKQGVLHVWRADNLGRFAAGDPGSFRNSISENSTITRIPARTRLAVCGPSPTSSTACTRDTSWPGRCIGSDERTRPARSCFIGARTPI